MFYNRWTEGKDIQQLRTELSSDDERHRLWTATWIVRQQSHKLKKKAIQVLFELFDAGETHQIQEDIAGDLGKYNPDDEYILGQLLKRIEITHHAGWGLFNIVQSKRGAQILLNLLNDVDSTIRNGAYLYFFDSDYEDEGEHVTRNYIDLDMIADFEEAIIYPEAQKYLDYWLEFHAS
jgi:hypothetical protein